MEFILADLEARALRRERRIRDRLDPLALSDAELMKQTRFPRQEIIKMCEELDPLLKRATKRGHAIPSITQILVALRIYASGSYQNAIGDTSGPAQSSVSRIFTRVTNILCNKAAASVSMPSSQQVLRESAREFHRFGNMPKIIGAIDCTHIAIKQPSLHEYDFVNLEGYHSINVQAVCNANGEFLNYCARFPGSSEDSFIWKNCNLRQNFLRGEFGDYMLIGDEGYPLEPFLMTPVKNPSTPAEHHYNSAHMRTRLIVERTFEILKNRFRCLHRSRGGLKYIPVKCARIIGACILLHNRCVRRGFPAPDEELPKDELLDVAPLDIPAEGAGLQTRENFIQEFFQHG